MAELTVCGLTYNNPEGAIQLVDDFYRLHDPSMFRILWLDQTREGIAFNHEVHLHVRSSRNLGFAKGMNTLWKLVQTPYTLLANDDVRLISASWYEEAKAHLKDGVLGVNPYPALRTWDGGGTPRWYYDIHGEWWQWTKDKPMETYTQEDYQKLQKKLWGGCSDGTAMFFTLMKTEAREIVGLLEEDFGIGNGEDYSWNRRCFLTCKNCHRRKYEHKVHNGEYLCDLDYRNKFQSHRILTCTHSLIHHHCGVTKQKASANKELDGYDLVANAKNIFNSKWGTDECKNPDIYGRDGRMKPTTEWCPEVPL